MALNDVVLDGNNVLKPIFDATMGNMVVSNMDNILQMLIAQGSSQDLKLGGKYNEIQFDDDLHAGGGYPDANNAVGHLYSDRPDHGVVGRVTPDFVVGYSTKPIQKELIAEEGGVEGNYFREYKYALDHATRQIGKTRTAHMMWEGYGKLNEVVLNSAAIPAGDPGTVRVAVRDHLQPQFLMDVRRTGSVIANVRLRIRSVSVGPQEGLITVVNEGSASYTPTAGDELYTYRSLTNAAMPGLLHACNDDPYPRAVLNNQAIDNDLFKAHVETPAGTGYLSHRDLIKFDQEGQGRMPEDVIANFDRRNKVRTNFGTLETCAGIYLMNHAMLNALRDTFFQTGNSGGINRYDRVNPPGEFDQGWGKVHRVDGILCHATNLMVPNVVLRVYAPGFKQRFGTPRTVTPQQFAGMSHVTGTLNTELILVQYGTCFVRNRMAQGRLNGRSGFDDAAAGWTEGGYED